jgi:hypothetical protein
LQKKKRVFKLISSKEEVVMIWDALIITCIGMGGVFLFLFLLICGMQILRIVISGNRSQDLEKIAIAVALTHHQK